MYKEDIRDKITISNHSAEASLSIAREIADLITEGQKAGNKIVLGLATGSSPIKVYEELVRMHREEALSFKNVTTFNLDEYFPMMADNKQSYHWFMNKHLFDHIDIPSDNIHIPEGTLTNSEEIDEYCKEYERKIVEAGGIDLQILGIGRSGHIGFNEPGSTLDSQTRLVTLDNKTRVDASTDFLGIHNVPRYAITMGIHTIMSARKVIMMAWGEGKAEIVEEMINGHISEQVPATFLQRHSNVSYFFDLPAASELAQVKTPWLLGSVDWSSKQIRKAVVWLCEELDKSILKLTNEDYIAYGMNELLIQEGSAYQINIEVFNQLQHTITGWPGGKPNADDSQRPERKSPYPKKSLIFSPHPDDDVISMGGTLMRLVDQKHEVHVAYQVSGNIAVLDDYAFDYIDFIHEFHDSMGISHHRIDELYETARQFLLSQKLTNAYAEDLRKIKGLIRRSEARSSCRFCGLAEENIHFMDLPFYETGEVKKMPLGEEDIQITIGILRELKPHQIFVAGDLSDPHGTHRVCLDAVFGAIRRIEKDSWLSDCKVWMYRGAWQEWDIGDIDMAVPISPEELMKKRYAIFKHQSQKDGVAFPGSDEREFWQRSEDRNRSTARKYNKLGMAEYEAMEAFVEWNFKREEN